MKPAPDSSRQNEAGSVSPELLEEIRVFFDATDSASFKTMLFHILLSYAGHYYYNAGEPVEVVETLDRLARLLDGVRRWAETQSRQAKSPDHVPVNPVDVLACFFEDAGYQNIESALRSIRFFALCRQSGLEDGAAIDTLRFYHDITCLVEACDSLRKESGSN